MKKIAFWLGTLGLLFIGAAIAQQGGQGIQITAPTGSEQVTVIGVSPQFEWVNIAQLRNATGYQTVATGTTVTSTPTYLVDNLIAIGAITTWNVTLPNPAIDGEIFSVVNGTGSAFTTNTTVTAATTPQNQTLANSFSSQTLAANGGSAEFTYVASTATWYRVR